MKNLNISTALLVSVLPLSAAIAETEDWTTTAELGFVNTSGNSKTSTVNAKADGTYEKDNWRNNLHSEILKTTSAGVTSANKIQASGQIDFKYNDTDYAFGLINYEDDKFSGFDYQLTLSGGYGKRILQETDKTLDIEVGPGLRLIKDSVTKVTDNEPLLRLAAKYHWDISKSAVLTEDLSADLGSDLTVTKSVTSIKTTINGSLAMKFSFTAKNTSNVPVGTKKLDTETAVTLVYSF